MITKKDLFEMFKKYEEDYLQFDQIKNPKHPKRDICAFLMLEELVACNGDRILGGSEHDQIWLSVDCNTLCEKLSEVATDELIRDLVRCGVAYDQRENSLYMFI